MNETVHYNALELVDRLSNNPHRWTRDQLSASLRANQLGNARIKSYESYHDTLVDVMKEAFPDMNDVLQPISGANKSSTVVPLTPTNEGVSTSGSKVPDLRPDDGEIKQEYDRQ